MSIYRKVRAAERLYARLARATQPLQEEAGLHCLPACGRCCDQPKVEAAPLEFLLLAYRWFLAGEAEQYLALDSHQRAVCLNFRPFGLPGQGRCTAFELRGLICRLFAYSLRRDKHGQPQLTACRAMKEETPQQLLQVQQFLTAGGQAPFATDYYRQLEAIDPALAREIMPINDAIREAVEAVLANYAYRPHPRRPRRAA